MAAIPPPSSLVGSGGPDEDSPFDGEKEREERSTHLISTFLTQRKFQIQSLGT